jgi:hypothetical protein
MNQFCLDSLGKERLNERISLFFCQSKGSNNQLFSLTLKGHLRKEEFCLAPIFNKKDSYLQSYLYFLNCPNQNDDRFEWKYQELSRTFVHVRTGLCLDISNAKIKGYPKIARCEIESQNQKWIFKKLSF